MRIAKLLSGYTLLIMILMAGLIACSDDEECLVSAAEEDDTTGSDDDDSTPPDDDDSAPDDDDDSTPPDDDDDDSDCVEPESCDSPYMPFDGCRCNYACEGPGPDYPPAETGAYAPHAGALTAPVEIWIDDYGMSHIYGDNMEDLLFAEGYRQAHDRLFQMEYFRRLVGGRLSEIYGVSKLDNDREARVAGFDRLGAQYWELMKGRYPSIARDLEAYVNGVNAYLSDADAGRNEASYGPEWDAIDPGFRPARWSPKDVYSFALAQAFALSFYGDFELIFSVAGLLLGGDVAEDLLRFQPFSPTYITEPSPSQFPNEFPGALSKRLQSALAEQISPNLDLKAVLEMSKRWGAFTQTLAGRSGGSNNWTLSGEHTQSGFPFVVDDPHLNSDLPANFWEVHLVDATSGADTIGIVIPGFPGVLIGHNRFVGWALTTTFADVTDIYLEVLSQEDTMASWRGENVPLQFINEEIKVRPNGGTIAEATVEPLTVRIVPHHGPIMNDLLPPTFASAIPFTVSFRWVGFEPVYSPGFVAHAPEARSLDDYKDALRFWGIGAQNHNVADIEGNIAYWAPSHYPNRPWDYEENTPSELLYSQGAHEWCGYMSFDEGVPHMLNPQKGYIVTANNSVLGETLDNNPNNDPRYFGHFYDHGTRAQRITARLEAGIEAGGGMTLADMSELQGDVHSVIADEILPNALTPELEAAACPTEESNVCKSLRLLQGWDRETTMESAAATVFEYFNTHIIVEMYKDDIPSEIWGAVSNSDLLNVLMRSERLALAGYTFPTGRDYFDNRDTTEAVETKTDILLAALTATSDQLTRTLGDDPATWTWGRVHFKLFKHNYPIAAYDRGPYAQPGGMHCVRRSDYNILSVGDEGVQVLDPPLYVKIAASMRYAVEMNPNADFPYCNALPGGNSGRPDNAHYDDQLPLWLAGECRQVPYTREAVEQAATRRMVLPAGFSGAGEAVTFEDVAP